MIDIRISKKFITLMYIGLMLLANLLSLNRVAHSDWIRYPILIIYTFILPGFIPFILLIDHKSSRTDLTSSLLHIVGISLGVITVTGLVLNTLQFIGLPHPLKKENILLAHSISLSFLLLIFQFARINFRITFKIPKQLNYIDLFLIFLSCLSVATSIFGAILLNNTGTNILTIVAIIINVAVLASALILTFRLKSFVFFIYSVGISTLLMLSLRSWYISGYDISYEYRIFLITLEKAAWTIPANKNAYNACLSLTIIPTFIQRITDIEPQYIFKLIYPSVFALVPVIIYKTLTKFWDNLSAFSGSAFFLAQPWFTDPMVTIARQEMGFFFFSILIFNLFSENYTSGRKLLTFFYAFLLVISHYSTSYITIVAFTGTFLIINILRLLSTNVRRNYLKQSNRISLTFLVYLSVTALFWYSQVTSTSENLTIVIRKTLENLNAFFVEDNRNAIVNQVFNVNYNPITKATYEDYTRDKMAEYANRADIKNFDPEPYSNYSVIPTSTQQIEIKNVSYYLLVNNYYKSIIVAIQVFFTVGILSLTFKVIKKSRIDINIEYLALGYVFVLLLAAIITLPFLSRAYNFDRLYLHSIIVAVIFFLSGIKLLNTILKKQLVQLILTLLLVSTFLFVHGPIWQVVGGKTVMWLNNFGLSYDLVYTHKSETLSAIWLKENTINPRVSVSGPARNQLVAYSGITNIINDVIPGTIDKNSYIYLTYANYNKNIGYFSYRGFNLGYVYPTEVINKSKNIIYNNGQSIIYK